jgi:ADP-ribose pyrophosphatase YjhB (NUDIX family)
MIVKSVQAVIFNKKTKKFLIIKEKDYYSENFYWKLVKGRIEKEEKEKEALKREIGEESGLKKIEIMNKVNAYSFIDPGGIEKHVLSFLVFAEGDEELIPNEEEEIIALNWVDRKKALSMLEFEQDKTSLKKALKHIPSLK